MEIDSRAATSKGRVLEARHVVLMAAGSLVAGLVFGYFLRGIWMPTPPPPVVAAKVAAPDPHAMMGAGHMPTLDQMKQMGDAKAAPLLEKLKTDPNNSTLLFQVASIYQATHQFKQAADYFSRTIQADPKNVAAHTELASCLYRAGDVDGAIAQLNQALSVNASDANSLFNLGVIKLEGKGDSKGALAAWQQLLKTNPKLSPERKAIVQQMMAKARGANPRATQGGQQ
jgi:cytochrome c-type biogenesis protein CcmH/NrfG